MKCHRVLIAALAIGVFAPVAQAQLLYQQTFEGGSAITDSGWSVEMFPSGGYSGTYAGGWDGGGLPVLSDAATGDPIGGAPPGTAVYIGNGISDPAGINGELGAFYVTEGLGGFENIDPATCERLRLSIYANTQGGGADDYGYFAVRLGDFDPRTADDAWYIASSPMTTPTENASALFNWRRRIYDPSPGNWNALSLGPLMIGGAAGNLSGLQITGVGIVQQLTNPQNDYSSWNYSDYRITCVPEPSALLLLAIAAPAWIVFRRRNL